MEILNRAGGRAGPLSAPGRRRPLFGFSWLRALGGALALAGAALAADWPVAAPGIDADPTWRWGRLDNGVRYVVRQHPLPAGRVSYRLALEVGTAHEAPGEEGFAHLVEHMAFNGTRRFKGETLIGELERRGVKHGPDSNAFTSLTHTHYHFDAPGTAPADVAWFLELLRDFCDGLLFESRQVKRERAVVEAEIRERLGPSARLDVARRLELYPGSRLSAPLLVLAPKSSPDQLRKFHRKCYRPDRAIVVVVGDAPVEDLETAVRASFGRWPAAGDPPPAFSPGELGNPPASTSRMWHDVGTGGIWLELVSLDRARPDGAETRRREIAAHLATYILTERLGAVARAHPSEINGTGARVGLATPFAYETSVLIQANSGAWELAARTIVDELRRSLEFTFHRAEIGDAKVRLVRAAELAAAAAGTADSATLASGAMYDAMYGRATLSPHALLAFMRATLPEIDSREIAAAWRSFWQAGRVRTFGYGCFTEPDAFWKINRLIAERSRSPLQALPAPRPVEFAYREFGAPTEVRSRRHDGATDLHLLEFANGVRVAYKRTDFSANLVDFAATFGDGLGAVPPQLPALGPLASAAFLGGGLGRHPIDQVRRILGTEPVDLNFAVGEAGFTFSG